MITTRNHESEPFKNETHGLIWLDVNDWLICKRIVPCYESKDGIITWNVKEMIKYLTHSSLYKVRNLVLRSTGGPPNTTFWRFLWLQLTVHYNVWQGYLPYWTSHLTVIILCVGLCTAMSLLKRTRKNIMIMSLGS